MKTIEQQYIAEVITQFTHFKERAELAFRQLTEDELHWKPSGESNSISIIIKHISGNMNSRWVDFLTTDGEKAYRDRGAEFSDEWLAREELMSKWEGGWKHLFDTLDNLKEEDLHKTITLRQKQLTVLSAIQTEIAHISYHLGQILYIGKQIKDEEWTILSIPKKDSK
ncbi:DUF1572 family protein [Sporosarcina limicola]|uniref:DUF1572 domain-containing protein n=1 Tax=Sporosarcina limicola TaxID=34101 RepID=A0A927MHY3_9BACL|nr:DUF1572 family protein [Sporosarcina limicola]MBE1554203.1 hypothetical protein [Sporosarcina limicola]